MGDHAMPTEKSDKSCCGPNCCDEEKASAKPRADEWADAVRETVKERYGHAVKAVMGGAKPSCCGSSAATDIGGTDPITRGLDDAEQTAGIPRPALLASLGRGNPTALAELKPGETVLDLGSGGGIDV